MSDEQLSKEDSEMIEEIKKRIENLIDQKKTENKAFKKLLRALSEKPSKKK